MSCDRPGPTATRYWQSTRLPGRAPVRSAPATKVSTGGTLSVVKRTGAKRSVSSVARMAKHVVRGVFRLHVSDRRPRRIDAERRSARSHAERGSEGAILCGSLKFEIRLGAMCGAADEGDNAGD